MTTIEPDIPATEPDPMRRAIAALTAFGGQALNRYQVGVLIRHWIDYDQLTHGDLSEIVAKFPSDPAEFMRARNWENSAYSSWMGVER
jgi:putative ubiquitin-RnfH superfamily antitoxin RatB of RatAB toxin-antitoxin module